MIGSEVCSGPSGTTWLRRRELRRLNESSDLDAQSSGDACEGSDARVRGARFELPDITRREASELRELFLGKAALTTNPGDVRSHGGHGESFGTSQRHATAPYGSRTSKNRNDRFLIPSGAATRA